MFKKVWAFILTASIIAIVLASAAFAQTSDVNSVNEGNQVTQVVASAETLPSTPTGLDIFQVGKNIMLKWDFIKNAHRYEIYRAGSRLGSYQKVGESRVPIFVDINPNASKYENYYKVVAVNNIGASSQSTFISLETKLFGDNMLFYNAKYDDLNAIGQEVNYIHDNKTFKEQFGTDRFGFYFKPGNYNDAGLFNIGYYTQINGLGKTPLETKIQNLAAPASLPNNNATCTFWRGAENFTVSADVNPGATMMWGVSQAAPMSRNEG